MRKASPSSERFILRTAGVSGAFLVYGLLVSCNLEPVGSSIVAGIAGFMVWVAARAALERSTKGDDDWAPP